MFNGVANGSGTALDNNGGIAPTSKPITPLLNDKPFSAANNPRSQMNHGGGVTRNMNSSNPHVTSEHIVAPQGQQSYSKGQQQLTQNFSRMKVSSGPNK